MKTEAILLQGNEMREITVVYERPPLHSMYQVHSPDDARYVISKMCEGYSLDYQEHFWSIFLNNDNRVLGYCEVSRGDATSTQVFVAQIFAISVKVAAKALILVHNHPSGKLKASEADRQIVRRIEEVGELLSISLLDNFIVTSESCLSFADEGYLRTKTSDTIPF